MCMLLTYKFFWPFFLNLSVWEDDFYCYLFISEGELTLPTLQRSVVHPLFDQGLTTAGLLQALLTEVVRRWGRLVPAPK